MTLYIDHKPAAVKVGTTLEYRSDNRLFSDREDYTLNIELPLHCPENDAIFGMIHRKDVDVEQVYFDAEIVCDNFVRRGAVVVTSVTDDMVKVQFIAGRSFSNFYPDWDNTMINTLEIGDWPSYNLSQSPSVWWGSTDYIALPWCNNTSGNVQNRADIPSLEGETLHWHTTADSDEDAEVVRGLSFQIRLYKLAEQICTALGYTFEAEDWRQSEWYHLYCFNTTPYAWDCHNWQSALPEWSVSEFFQHLERLLGMEIDINHHEQTVTIKELPERLFNVETIDDIVDEFTMSVSKDDESQYLGSRNIAYQDAGHHLQNFYSCPWLFNERKNLRIREFADLDAIIAAMRSNDYAPSGGRLNWSTNIMHDMTEDIYYCCYYITCLQTEVAAGNAKITAPNERSVYGLMPVNLFGPVIHDEAHIDEAEEIGFVPAWRDDAFDSEFNYKGNIVFLECGEKEGISDDAADKQPNLVAAAYIELGSQRDNHGAFNTIAVAFWYGSTAATAGAAKLPRPWLHKQEVLWSWTVQYRTVPLPSGDAIIRYPGTVTWWSAESGHNASLRLTEHPAYQGMPRIDDRKKYEFSFLSDTMPDVRAIFVIKGKRYLCSQIRAEISEQGMSRLMKGVFWRLE